MVLSQIQQNLATPPSTAPEGGSSGPPTATNSMAFLQLPEEEKFDKTAANLLKVVKKLIAESFDMVQSEIEKKIHEEGAAVQVRLEEKVNEVSLQCFQVQKRLDPLLQMMNVS